MESADDSIDRAVEALRSARHPVAFTGAGISVESGIPPFRGPGGLWSRYNPRVLDIDYFDADPAACWPVLKEIFYDYFGAAQPNAAHRALAQWERSGRLGGLITQNIDDLHQRAGSRFVIEYHGNSAMLACRSCGARLPVAAVDLSMLPPRCRCGSILKPDFVFFGEGIPSTAQLSADHAVRRADVLVIVGTTGEVYPAALLPREARLRGAIIIEINPEESAYTADTTHIFIRSTAVDAFTRLAGALG